MKVYRNIYNSIISSENLFSSWDKFKSDKQKKRDVLKFEWNLEENIFQLHRDLESGKYKHGAYSSFYLRDPKQRHVHKAEVKDRILHHAVFKVLNPIFEPTFISNSFSCQTGKGTHKGISTLDKTLRQISSNNFKPCFALKCDVKKFFDTVDHSILLSIIRKRIKDATTIRLLEKIINSFSSEYSNIFYQKGLPIGNLTSQLFANIYLNEFDQFIKHKLKVKNYVRYTDDFVIISNDKTYLENLIASISSFLSDKLSLKLHPKKVSICKFRQGIDFLGYIVLPHYRLLRTKTKNRIIKKLKNRVEEYKNKIIDKKSLEQSLNSYLGVLSHADTHGLEQYLKNQFWFWLNE
ncbi:MAG: reverse transcriptase/maturase family protein [Candidatus Staskawiczbacteria bacterium]|nr:reverse transcriptase/maturase family protein [Candidatus Staskawiczbacteria bacterium]